MLDSARFMPKPIIAVLAGEQLFASFFDAPRRARLSGIARWRLISTPDVTNGRIGTPRKRQLDGSSSNRLLTAALAGVEALITTWDSPYLSAGLMDEIETVRMIAHCGGEVKRKFETSLFRKLVIVNTPGPMSRPTAELGAAFLLYLARNVDHYRVLLRSRSNRIYGDFHAKGEGTDSLLGREVGMIGFGRIGRALVEMLRGFDIRWRVYDPYASRGMAGGSSVQFVSLNSVLTRSTLLVVTAAATEKTRHLLNQERLATLQDGTAVVNIARGSLIDLSALTDEVRKGRLRCALDVTDPDEPLPIGHPLRTLPGAIITPHVGGGGRQTRGQMADGAMDELQRFFRGKRVENRVTTAMLRRMT